MSNHPADLPSLAEGSFKFLLALAIRIGQLMEALKALEKVDIDWAGDGDSAREIFSPLLSSINTSGR